VFKAFPGCGNTDGKLGAGVETKARGAFTVAPSLHASGEHYKWVNLPSRTPIADAPEWLVAWFQARERERAEAAARVAAMPKVDPSKLSDKYAARALEDETSAVSQCQVGRANQLNVSAFKLGQLVGAGVLNHSEAEGSLMAAAAECGLVKDDGFREAQRIIAGGLRDGAKQPRQIPERRASTRPPRSQPLRVVAESSPHASASAARQQRPEPEHWRDELVLNADGGFKRQSFHNAVLTLMNLPETAGLFVYDEFRQMIMVTRRPPWAINGFEPGPLADPDISGCRLWLERQHVAVSKNDTFNAVEYVAAQKHINPVRDYFERQAWDGVERLDHWLIDFLGVDDTSFARAAGAKWMIGAVARVFRPGAKVDTMLILEGPQGIKKSSALACLATLDGERFFTDEIAALGSRDAAQQLGGNLIVEMAELDAIGKADVTAIKAFLTRQVDKVRLPYARTVSSLRRQCVFAGTVNPDGTGYLRDRTGGRRFWPVLCSKIDLDALEVAKPQLWAEAVHRFNAGEVWWIEDQVVLEEARQAQEDRAEIDPLHARVETFLRDKRRVTTEEIIFDAWAIPPQHANAATYRRAANALRDAGWKRKKVKLPSGKTRWMFYDPSASQEWTQQD
jgi:predicted P-loop ATPase